MRKRKKPLPIETRRKIACATHGHCGVVNVCFGYVTCARCSEHLGDTLMGAYDPSDDVLEDHDCDACRANARKLTRRQMILLPKKIRDQVKALRAG